MAICNGRVQIFIQIQVGVWNGVFGQEENLVYWRYAGLLMKRITEFLTEARTDRTTSFLRIL